MQFAYGSCIRIIRQLCTGACIDSFSLAFPLTAHIEKNFYYLFILKKLIHIVFCNQPSKQKNLSSNSVAGSGIRKHVL